MTRSARRARLCGGGDASCGIVPATDAMAEDSVSVVGLFPTDTHPSIIWPAADRATRDFEAEVAFLDYLRGPEARAAFERQGVVAGADQAMAG